MKWSNYADIVDLTHILIYNGILLYENRIQTVCIAMVLSIFTNFVHRKYIIGGRSVQEAYLSSWIGRPAVEDLILLSSCTQ